MIVLTYIKLHQSAMRDIVLLVDHAIFKKKKKKKAASLHFNKKFSCSVRGSYGALLSGVVWKQTVGRSACALDLKVNQYVVKKLPLKHTRQLHSVCVQFLFSVQENLFLLKLKINYRLFDPHI